MSLPLDDFADSDGWQYASYPFHGQATSDQYSNGSSGGSLSSSLESDWPFPMQCSTADHNSTLHFMGAGASLFTNQASSFWQPVQEEPQMRFAPDYVANRSLHGLLGPPTWPMLSSHFPAEPARTLEREPPSASARPSSNDISADDNAWQRESVAATFPGLPLERSVPSFQLECCHQQSVRFKGDLYTATWVRGDGAEREGWCGYCSSWHRLKDSAYWVRMTIISDSILADDP